MMSSLVFPPGLILIFGAVLVAVLRGKARIGVALTLPVLTLAYAWLLISSGDTLIVTSLKEYLGFTLTPVAVNAPTKVFATAFCLMAFAGSVFALKQKNPVELPAALVYAGSAISITFAGDLLTMFIFWEIMTLGSTVVIWSAGTQKSFRAGMRYFGVHIFGGVTLIAGIIMHIQQLKISGVPDPASFTHFQMNLHKIITEMSFILSWDDLGAWLIMLGMLVNAGAPPFSAWVPDAYPEASESGTVFLSAFTTKTAVFVLMVTFAGTPILIYIGVYMAVYGIIYAIRENDIRRLIAYSVVNQVGFMICGIGIGSKLALNGASAHAFVCIIYTALLMMSAGSVLRMTGKRKFTDLGGLYRTMPLTAICGAVGALSISAFPFTSGFVSKTMIPLAAAQDLDNSYAWVWFVLEAVSAGVFLFVGIKFVWFAFFQKDSGLRPPEPPLSMRIAMVFFAVICLGIGSPGGFTLLYEILPFAVGNTPASSTYFVPYTFGHVVTQLELLLFAGGAFFLLLPVLKPRETITLDWDYFYRRFFPAIWNWFVLPLLTILYWLAQQLLNAVPRLLFGELRHEDSHHRLPRPWAVGRSVLLITFILLLYLISDFWTGGG